MNGVRLNLLQPSVAFLYPLENIRKPSGVLMFLWGKKKLHWFVMS